MALMSRAGETLVRAAADIDIRKLIAEWAMILVSKYKVYRLEVVTGNRTCGNNGFSWLLFAADSLAN